MGIVQGLMMSYGGKRQPGVNTVAYYPLKNDTNDYSMNNRHGVNNGVEFIGGCAVFDGSSYISLGNESWTAIQSSMTISVWFRWNGDGAKDNPIFSKSLYYMPSHGGAQYTISVHENKRILMAGYYNGSDYNAHPLNFRTTSGGTPTLGPVTQANRRYHIVLTNNGTNKKAYIDGVLKAEEDAVSTTSASQLDTRIGGIVKNNYDAFFNGNIQNVIIENKTRTQEEITAYYNQTKNDYL